MSTATQTSNGAGVLEQLQSAASGDPMAAILAETERLRKENESQKRALAEATEVGFGPDGLEIRTIGGLWRIAKMYAASRLVPDHFHNKPEDCAVIVQLAQRLKADVFMVMQNTYIVHGRPGMEAKLQIALANNSGVFRGPIRFEMKGQGKSRSCTAYAIDAKTGERCEMPVDMETAEREGWLRPKKDQPSKWVTMPELMLRYRAASWLIRTHCPEVVMGMQSLEEIEDIRSEAQQRMGADVLRDILEAGPTVETPTPDMDPPFNPPTPEEAASVQTEQTIEPDLEQRQMEAEQLFADYQAEVGRISEETELGALRDRWNQAWSDGLLTEAHRDRLEAAYRVKLGVLQKPPKRR